MKNKMRIQIFLIVSFSLSIICMAIPGHALEVPTDTGHSRKPATNRDFRTLPPKDQKSILNCLCACNSEANKATVQIYYDPTPLGDLSPSCGDTKKGPCVNRGFGCWRHFPARTADCMKQCARPYSVGSIPEDVLNGRR